MGVKLSTDNRVFLIHTATNPAPLMHTSDSRAMVQCKYFLIVPTVLDKCGGYNTETLTLVGFSVV